MPQLLQSTVGVVVGRGYLTSDHLSKATGLDPVFTISKNGGNFANPAAGASVMTEIEATGWYKFTLGIGDTDTLGPLIIRGTHATMDDIEVAYEVVAVPAAAGEAAAALVAVNLDHLVGTATGIPALPAGTYLDARTLAAAGYGTSTYAGGDTTGVTELLTRVPDATPGTAGGLPTVNADNKVAGVAGVTFPANVGTSTYAGTDTSGTTELLTRVPDATPGTVGGLPTVDAANMVAGVLALGAQAKLDVNAEADTALTDYGANKVASPTMITAQEVRDALKLAPTAGAPAAGSVDKHLDDLPTSVTPAAPSADDVAAKILVTPANKLATDVSGRVTAGTISDKNGYGLADDAITASKFDETTAFPLKSVDTGATQVARVGADADTLETLSDQIDNISVGAGLTAQQVRDALKLAPTAGAPAAGSIDKHLDDLPTTVTPSAPSADDVAAKILVTPANKLATDGTGRVTPTTVTPAGLDAAGVRTAIGLATANLDAQLVALPTDLDVQAAAAAALTVYGVALESTLTAIKGVGWTTETLRALDVLLTAIGGKTINLPGDPADQSQVEVAITAAVAAIRGTDNDTLKTVSDQVDDLPTNAELATALAGADDAVLAAIGALNNLSASGAQVAAAAALVTYTAATVADVIAAADAVRGSDSDTLKTLSEQIDGVPAATDVRLGGVHGVGAWGMNAAPQTKVYTVTDSLGNPLAQVLCRLTTDAAGLNLVDAGYTNIAGQVAFHHNLIAGTPVWVFRWRPPYVFDPENDPETI